MILIIYLYINQLKLPEESCALNDILTEIYEANKDKYKDPDNVNKYMCIFCSKTHWLWTKNKGIYYYNHLEWINNWLSIGIFLEIYMIYIYMYINEIEVEWNDVPLYEAIFLNGFVWHWYWIWSQLSDEAPKELDPHSFVSIYISIKLGITWVTFFWGQTQISQLLSVDIPLYIYTYIYTYIYIHIYTYNIMHIYIYV